MRVRMKVNTQWAGAALHPGDVVDVDQAVAARWFERGIAERAFDRVTRAFEEPAAAEEPDERSMHSLSLAELRAHAEALGITTAGLRSKAAVIAAIEAESGPTETSDDEEPGEDSAGEEE